jgi:hypothetical protein
MQAAALVFGLLAFARHVCGSHTTIEQDWKLPRVRRADHMRNGAQKSHPLTEMKQLLSHEKVEQDRLRSRLIRLASFFLALHGPTAAWQGCGHSQRCDFKLANGNSCPKHLVMCASRSPPAQELSRRAYINGAVLATFAPSILPTYASAPIRITTYPAVEYLVYLYEFAQIIDRVASAASDTSTWPALQKRLNDFFSGGLLSEQRYYFGLAQLYNAQIVYDDLDEFVKQDKFARLELVDRVGVALFACKTALEAESPDAAEVTSSLTKAKTSIGEWFGLLPKSEVLSCDQFIRNRQQADKDGDGKLSKEELATLSEADQATIQRLSKIPPPPVKE